MLLSLTSSLYSQVVQQAILSLCIPLKSLVWNLQTLCRAKLSTISLTNAPETPTMAAGAAPPAPPLRFNPQDGSVGASERSDSKSGCHTLWWVDRLSQQAAPAGVGHSSELCYFWQADYVMSRDGFANPAACVCVCACEARDDPWAQWQ